VAAISGEFDATNEGVGICCGFDHGPRLVETSVVDEAHMARFAYPAMGNQPVKQFTETAGRLGEDRLLVEARHDKTQPLPYQG
jgi:hypothetical protein